jgi:hypothetical protein
MRVDSTWWTRGRRSGGAKCRERVHDDLQATDKYYVQCDVM